jgi:hypothetical protein
MSPNPVEDNPPRRRSPLPLALRGFFVILAAIGLSSLLWFWFIAVRPIVNHGRAYDRLSTAVQSLTRRRPPGVSKDQWSYIIGWTMNAIGNCCSAEGFLNPDAESRERFATLPERFEERLQTGQGWSQVGRA